MPGAGAATLNSHQMWVPYDTPKDCSQGFCSIYCPQWCYIIFPPPPPFGFDSAYTTSSTTAFSPLVIAIIGVLASAFLLVSYYTIISKYCGTFATIRHRLRRHTVTPADTDGDGDGDDANPSLHHEPTWHISTSNGLEETLISKITLYRYKRGEGVVDGTDCSVCLSEFCEDESLRLLPKCSHAFHLQCIDTWLRSHSNCPLCRANIVSVAPQPEIETTNAPTTEVTEVVVLIEDVDSGTEEQDPAVDLDDDACKDIVEVVNDDFRSVRRSFSMDSSSHSRLSIASSHSRLSIADVLLTSIEDELSAAKEQGCFSEAGSSRRMVGELGKGRCRSLHCVMSPVSMKRSFSSGRFCFARGRNSVLPL